MHVRGLLSTLLIGALLTSCQDPQLDEADYVLDTFDVALSAKRVVPTPGGSAELRITLVRDDDQVPVELTVAGTDDLEAKLGASTVTTESTTLTLRASPKAQAQAQTITLEAHTDGGVVSREVVVSVQVPTRPTAGVEEYAPGVIGEPATFVIGKVTVPAQVINGIAIAGGDMVLGEVNALESAVKLRSATCNPWFHTEFHCSPWTGGVIGYSFRDDWGSPEANDSMRRTVEDAIARWEAATGLNFVHRDYGEHIEFRNGGGCSSTVGRAVITGFDSQSVSLHNDCNHVGVVMHEIGHAIGLYHEQSRNDRDAHVVVDFGRVRDGLLSNFFQWGEWLRDRGIYDFDSIMHYGRSAFARNAAACDAGNLAECTIRPHDPDAVIGQRDHLSEGDIMGAYTLYPPAYRISGVTAGETDDEFLFSLVYDTEAPRADRMVWTSDRVATPLGTGHSLWLRGGTVPAGTHVISASLVIAGVTVTSRSVTINVANAAPSVTLAATDGRTVQDLGRWFTMATTVSDVENGTCPVGLCRYSWTPPPTTGPTTSRTAIYRFNTVGPQNITVRVEDHAGAVTTVTRTISIVNSAPVATIARPSSAIEVFAGVGVALEGSATDINESTGTLPCTALRWSSSNPGDTFSPSATGCTPTASFAGTGPRTISLVATDPQGRASAPATVVVTVRACSGTCGPTALLTLPTPDWVLGGVPVYYRESSVALRGSIGHSLAPANNPVTYRLTGRRAGSSTTFEIGAGSATVTSPGTSIPFNLTWVVAGNIAPWSLCDNPGSFRDYELALVATDSAGVQSTQRTAIKVGCTLF